MTTARKYVYVPRVDLKKVPPSAFDNAGAFEMKVKKGSFKCKILLLFSEASWKMCTMCNISFPVFCYSTRKANLISKWDIVPDLSAFFRPCEIITLENCGEGDPRSSVTILGTTCLIWCVKWKSCPFISSCPYWALPFVPSTHLKVLQLVRTHCCSGSGHSNFTDLIQCGKESKSYCKLVQVCICVYLSTPTHEWKVWQQRDSSLFVKVFEMFRMG